MEQPDPSASKRDSLVGVTCAALSFLIWGMGPIYWKALGDVPSLEIICHRVVWSLLFLLPILFFSNQWREAVSTFKKPRTLLVLLATTILLTSNWLIFIWAINHDYVLQTSLGYYINPLINVLLGVVFLKERLRPLQLAAVLLAAGSVLFLTLQYGAFPWVALLLALTFGFYGLIRKVAPVRAAAGLSLEMFLACWPAAAYLVYLDAIDAGSLFHVSRTIDLLFIGTALVTAIPLLFFNLGAKLLNLSTLGFLQYIAPSCFFLLAVFIYHEPISTGQVGAFVVIWVALVSYSVDSLVYYRRAVLPNIP
jgi:chloramphenicol-sensitive protein RarD